MFIPFGVMTAYIGFKKYYIILSAPITSFLIEFLQLHFMRGMFELDDLISNTTGAIIGYGLFLILEKQIKEKKISRVISVVIHIIIIVSLCVFVFGEYSIESDSSSRVYCFQVDKVDFIEDCVTLKGFVFQFDSPNIECDQILQSVGNGQRINLTKRRVDRKDVALYFDCKQDNIGFVATGTFISSDVYEIFIKWPFTIPVSTGVFISENKVFYVADKKYAKPQIDAPFVENGKLLVYRPDIHCWIYQYEESLYWIVDQDFNFEENNKTYIQYQLWTTRKELLPRKRIENGWNWDNIGGNFEDFEIQGDWNGYRVMKRELPTSYPITSILTGYYKDGKWIWQEYYRPYYEFN